MQRQSYASRSWDSAAGDLAVLQTAVLFGSAFAFIYFHSLSMLAVNALVRFAAKIVFVSTCPSPIRMCPVIIGKLFYTMIL